MTAPRKAAPDMAPVDERLLELLHLLRAVGSRSRPSGGLAQLIRRTGILGPRHLPLLLMLSLEGELTVGELAERVRLTPATTSLLANELNRAGLLERREDERDRRRTILSVPDEHRVVIEEHARHRIAPLQRALSRLGSSRSEQLLEALRVLSQELEAADSEDCS